MARITTKEQAERQGIERRMRAAFALLRRVNASTRAPLGMKMTRTGAARGRLDIDPHFDSIHAAITALDWAELVEDPKQRQVLAMRVQMDGKRGRFTMREIAKELRISPRTANRLRMAALDQIASRLRAVVPRIKPRSKFTREDYAEIAAKCERTLEWLKLECALVGLDQTLTASEVSEKQIALHKDVANYERLTATFNRLASGVEDDPNMAFSSASVG